MAFCCLEARTDFNCQNYLWSSRVSANDSQSTMKSKDVCATIMKLKECLLLLNSWEVFHIRGLHVESRYQELEMCRVRKILISRLNQDQYSCLYYWWVMWNLHGEGERSSIRTDDVCVLHHCLVLTSPCHLIVNINPPKYTHTAQSKAQHTQSHVSSQNMHWKRPDSWRQTQLFVQTKEH